ncbi:hypothetical protein ES702_06237 [subsurface metagenome]
MVRGFLLSLTFLLLPWLKGGDDMAEGPSPEIEVERVMNLVRGFGWEKVKEEIINDEVHLEIKKRTPAAAAAGPGPGPS